MEEGQLQCHMPSPIHSSVLFNYCVTCPALLTPVSSSAPVAHVQHSLLQCPLQLQWHMFSPLQLQCHMSSPLHSSALFNSQPSSLHTQVCTSTSSRSEEGWTCTIGAEEDTGVKRTGHVTLELGKFIKRVGVV